MRKSTVEFGGGHLPPAVKQHVVRIASTKTSKQKPLTQFGGGHLPPSVKVHLSISK